MMGQGNGTAGMARREEFDATELSRTAESATSAAAAAAQATIQARYIMSLRRPRNLDETRIRLLKECDRPQFAEVAWYLKPIGKGVRGPSIRFAEAAARYMGNLLIEAVTTFEDDEKELISVQATDLETNTTHTVPTVVHKTVERSSADGRTVVRTRKNKKGQPVYVVVADDDEVLNKRNAQISKAMRNVILRLVPGDLVDECAARVKATIEKGGGEDIGARRKKLCDAFAEVGVLPSKIEEFLGHSLDTASPAELADLRALYQAIRDGEVSFQAALEHARSQRGEGESAQQSEASEKQSKLAQEVAEKLEAAKRKQQERTAPPAKEPAPAQEPTPVVDVGAEKLARMSRESEAKTAPPKDEPELTYQRAVEQLAEIKAAAKELPSVEDLDWTFREVTLTKQQSAKTLAKHLAEAEAILKHEKSKSAEIEARFSGTQTNEPELFDKQSKGG